MTSFTVDRRSLLLALPAGALLARTTIAQQPIHRASLSALTINAAGGFNPTDINWRNADQTPTLAPRIFSDAMASGMTIAAQTMGYVFGAGEPFEDTVRDIGLWDRLLAADRRLLKIGSVADIFRAKEDHLLGLIPVVQNSDMLGDRAERVEIFADLGIKSVQLTYNLQNRVGSGCLSASGSGLTRFGEDVVARLNSAKTIVDAAHGSDRLCMDAARVSTAPIAVSHTGCRALRNHPRNTSDEALRLVALKGGFVGIFFMPYLVADRNARPDDVVSHIEHAVSVCGEDHVGIGTDGGTTEYSLAAAQRDTAIRYAERKAAGIAAPGEAPHIVSYVPGMGGPEQFHQLARLLAGRGHGSRRIEKILGSNYIRFARDVWGA